MKSKLATLMLLTLPGLCSAATPARAIMLDYGSTTASGASLTNSPYHAVNGAFADTTWNKEGQSTDSTIYWSDGTSATNVTSSTLKNASGGATLLSSAGWSASVSGTAINTGVYVDTSVGKDGYAMSTTFNDTRAIGIQVSGLDLGAYDIYIVGRNTNYSASEYAINFYAAAGSTVGSYNIASGFAVESVAFAASATDKTSAWVFDPGDPMASNYVKMTVRLTEANPYLNIATMGNAGADVSNGYFNAIQIVPVFVPAGTLVTVR